MQAIRIIPSAHIEPDAWDACINRSANGLIYSRYHYLQHLCHEWYGLVVDDYDMVMALPLRNKWGWRYTYMPAFTQQLGLVGPANANTDLIAANIEAFIRYGSPYLNFGNANIARQVQAKAMSNYIIALQQPYTAIRAAYKKGVDYSIGKSVKAGATYVPSHNVGEAIQLYRQSHSHKMLHVQAEDYARFEKLCRLLKEQNNVLVRKVEHPQLGLLSLVLLLKDNKRYYNIINYTTHEGRRLEANYLLYDNLLQELAQQDMLFDFEGSDLPGVKSFYEKFGAINQPYYHWHFNNLPFWLRWLKK
jgi:hypothetical protein